MERSYVTSERSEGYKSGICPFVRAWWQKSAALAHFISPGWCRPWLPNTPQARHMPSATQAWAILVPVLWQVRA